MNSQVGFVVKVAIASLILSELVKYGGRLLPLSGDNLTALIIVVLPSIILAIVFGWRLSKIQN